MADREHRALVGEEGPGEVDHPPVGAEVVRRVAAGDEQGVEVARPGRPDRGLEPVPAGAVPEKPVDALAALLTERAESLALPGHGAVDREMLDEALDELALDQRHGQHPALEPAVEILDGRRLRGAVELHQLAGGKRRKVVQGRWTGCGCGRHPAPGR